MEIVKKLVQCCTPEGENGNIGLGDKTNLMQYRIDLKINIDKS